jgi:hypothetical protein
MRTLGLMPVRNEATMLPFSLACLSAFSDVILVNDQASEDQSRAICRQFPKVVLIESATAAVCEIGRWKLLDAARDYEGNNLLWWSDADELVSPSLFREFLAAHHGRLEPGTVIESRFYHLWNRPDRYRNDGSLYAPHWKALGLVDDRTVDFDRQDRLPLHQPRIPEGVAPTVVRSDELRVFHLQWLMGEANQMKQAWYRCREWLEGRSAADVNRQYSITLPAPRARTSMVPAEWVGGLSFPHPRTGAEISWQEREVFEWFREHGAEFFEPLELWHIPKLRQYFREHVGRRPKPDRSYLPPLTHRARHMARRVVNGTRRRLLP